MNRKNLTIGLVPILLVLFLSLPVARAAGPAADAKRNGPADAAALLDRLGREVAGFRTLKTEFTQEKRLAVFQNAVVLKGRIVLQKPDRIAWHVDTPVRYSVVISDASVRQWDEDTGRVQEISLARNPVLQNALHQLTVWFSGSYGSLLRDYDVEVAQASPAAFRFLPKGTNMAAKVVREIRIEFREDHKYLRKLTIIEQGGDSTDITFTGTLFDVPIDARDFEVKQRV